LDEHGNYFVSFLFFFEQNTGRPDLVRVASLALLAHHAASLLACGPSNVTSVFTRERFPPFGADYLTDSCEAGNGLCVFLVVNASRLIPA